MAHAVGSDLASFQPPDVLAHAVGSDGKATKPPTGSANKLLRRGTSTTAVPFRDLIDQQRARILLQSALRSGRIAHAYLFVGPSGVGRLAAAHAFAQALLCASAGDDACGLCGPCR